MDQHDRRQHAGAGILNLGVKREKWNQRKSFYKTFLENILTFLLRNVLVSICNGQNDQKSRLSLTD